MNSETSKTRLKNLEDKISDLNYQSVNNMLDKISQYSWLNLAVYEGKIPLIREILKIIDERRSMKGSESKSDTTIHYSCDLINGITNDGLAFKTPLTVANYGKKNYLEIIRYLLLKGANINLPDLSGETILTTTVNFFMSFPNKEMADLIVWLLSRGADPNGTIFNNPLVTILENTGKTDPTSERGILIAKTIKNLFLWGADPTCERIFLNGDRDNTYRNAISILNDTDMHLSVYSLFYPDYNELVDSDPEWTERLSIYFKDRHPSDEDGEDYINPNIAKGNFVNVVLSSGNNPEQFLDRELIYYIGERENEKFVFHCSEIPYLLASRKNPFTNHPFPEKFLVELIDKYTCIPEITLEEAKEMFNRLETPRKSYTRLLVDEVTRLLASYFPYPLSDKLFELEANDLVYILLIFNEYNPSSALPSSALPSSGIKDFQKRSGENLDAYVSRLIERVATLSILLLRKSGAYKLLLNIILDPNINQVRIRKEFINLFPEKLRERAAKLAITLSSPAMFIMFISAVLKLDQTLCEYRPFISSLDETEREIVPALDQSEIVSYYQKYLAKNIGDLIMSDPQNWPNLIEALSRCNLVANRSR